MKKIIMILLSLMLAVSVFGTGQSDDSVAGSALKVSAPGVFPIVDESVTLTFAAVKHAAVEDYATNAFTLFMEKLTNVHIEWEEYPSEGAAERLNLILASGDYPDVLFGFSLNSAQITQYGVEE